MSFLELWYPFPLSTRTQSFGENAAPLYKEQGLLGHTAEDWQPGYGAEILNCANDAYCYSLMNKDEPDLTKYRGVFTVVESDDGFVYEISYGHCKDMFAEVGKTYQAGDLIATVGNAGPIYTQGRPINDAERATGFGAHLHGPQVRKCKKVTKVDNTKGYLKNGQGLFKKDGFYYEIVDISNGYNGCVNPTLFYNGFEVQTAKVRLKIWELTIELLKTKIAELLGKK
jgi:murein DD-endopeptidase MepM/ murein hydrolase activator NlpD